MIIRTISFDPIKVTVDDVEVPVIESTYQDEDGIMQKVIYVEANGEKVPIQYQTKLIEHSKEIKIDQALERVESKRLEKVELDKNEVKP